VRFAGRLRDLVRGAFWVVTQQLHGAARDVVYQLAWLNFLFAIFNTLPAVPLDGGRMLIAIVWKIIGNRHVCQPGVIGLNLLHYAWRQ
jgi:Zn-dependent protease